MLPSPYPLHVTLICDVVADKIALGSLTVAVIVLVHPLISFMPIVYVPAINPLKEVLFE